MNVAHTASTPDSIQYAMMTVARQPAYIHRTLEGWLSTAEHLRVRPTLRLSVGSDDSAYLDRYRDVDDLTVCEMSRQEWEHIRDWSVFRKFSANYYRCLSTPVGENSPGLCILEDDVILRESFFENLCDTIDEMENQHGIQHYVLACYAAYRFESDPSLYRGSLFCRYPVQDYYGTQCVFYSRAVLAELRDYFYKHGIERPGPDGDMIVKDFCIEHQNLYACTRSIVQHVGAISTGLGPSHESPTFHLPFEPVERW